MESLIVNAAYDQSPIKTIELMSEDQVMQIMEASHKLYLDRKSWLSKHQRIQILDKTMTLIESRKDELILQAAKEGGKPLVDSRAEILRGINGIAVAIEEINQLTGHEIPMGQTPSSEGRSAYTKRMPRGVVVAISAFNHPFNLIVHQVIPAVATGCPVIVKPASTTPLSCMSLVDILYEAGLPKDWCQVVNCDNSAAEKLVKDERNSFLSFIGSSRVGWYLRSQLPPGANCALEHGGVAPAIVDETADLDRCIPLLSKGAFYHAGQVCVSVQRILAHSSILPRLAEQLTAAAKALKVGDPTLEDTEVGPLITPQEVDRVHEWVEEARNAGAQILCGGNKISDTCYEPTVILNPPKDIRVSKEEIFGPVVCLYAYESLDDAIAQANDVDYAFQASIFTNQLNASYQAIDELEAMAVMVNDHTAFRVDWMPFGGYKKSGLGVGGIGHSMKDMTIEKLYVMKH